MPRDAAETANRAAPANRAWPGLPAEHAILPTILLCELLAHPRAHHTEDTCGKRSPPSAKIDLHRAPTSQAVHHNSPQLGQALQGTGRTKLPDPLAPRAPKMIKYNSGVNLRPGPCAVLKRLL